MQIRNVDLDSLDRGETFLQSPFWGELKSRFGWSVLAFERDCGTSAEDGPPQGDQDRFPLLVLLRTLPGGFLLAYIPHGPQGAFGGLHGEALQRALVDLCGSLRKALPPRTLFIRFDLPNFTKGLTQFPEPLGPPFFRAPTDIQPPDTVVLDLASPLDTLLESMKKKTRYNIKLAQKGELEYREGSLEDLEAWYQLYRQTAVRDKIAIHSYEYYKTQFELAKGAVQGVSLHLLLAYHKGLLLAGNIVLIYAAQGVYLYGASSNEHRNLMAPYGLQWQSLRLCQEKGCQTYDFFGIPPTDDETHPMHGLYRFKTGFGGDIVHRMGSWDFPIKRILYRFYRWVERLRTWYFKKLKKR